MPRRAPPHAWRPGESGNPSGRRPGCGKVAALRAKIAEALPEVLAAIVARAKQGDAAACRLLIERGVPAIRPMEQGVALSLPVDGTVSDQARAVLAAAAAGELGPMAAAQLLAAVAGVARVLELDELQRRIERLEGLHDGD